MTVVAREPDRRGDNCFDIMSFLRVRVRKCAIISNYSIFSDHFGDDELFFCRDSPRALLQQYGAETRMIALRENN